jgi:hypothetical protein
MRGEVSDHRGHDALFAMQLLRRQEDRHAASDVAVFAVAFSARLVGTQPGE